MHPALITTSWDDGHPSDMRLAEMLDRHGLTGTFYIPRSIPTGVLPDGEIRELSNRFEIGAHTLNHVFLSDTDRHTAEREIAGSKGWVEEITGKRCEMFCPPAGRYKRFHLPMFRDAGYAGIRSVEFMSLDWPRENRLSLLEMPTTLQVFNHPAASYVRNAAKRAAIANLWRYVIYGRSTSWAVLARRLLARVCSVGGVFHLWGHSWELDANESWGELEDVMGLMADAVRSGVPCLTNGEVCRRVRHEVVGASPAITRPLRQ